MKAKLFIASAAMLSLFAACTQDELPVASEGAANLSGRIEAGVAEITTNDMTRFNVLNAGTPFENGDKLGLYLMDEFRGNWSGAEHSDANTTDWKTPAGWFYYWDSWNVTDNNWVGFAGMYNPVNYIQTNYQYVYNDGKWVNPASKLVEGNYMLMYPQNEVATNRRDLWFSINPEVNMVEDANKPHFFRGYDNQVFLGYQRVLRDQAAENGVLTMKADLKSLMTYLKISIYNGSSTEFMPERIVFTKADDTQAVPTLAYVMPADKNLPSLLEVKHLEGKDPVCGGDTDWYEWNDNVGLDGNFTQADAQAIVAWDAPITKVPYGASEAQKTVAYEYTFNFPAGTLLKDNRGGSTDESEATVQITLPALTAANAGNALNTYVAKIYGKKYDPHTKSFRYGYVTAAGVDNGSFGLKNIPLWSSDVPGTKMPSVTVDLDDKYFVFLDQEYVPETVNSTDELKALVEGKISEATNNVAYGFAIKAVGNKEIALNSEIDALISEYNAKNPSSPITVEFTTADPAVITLTAENVLGKDFYHFDNANVVVEAKQVLAEDNYRYVWAKTITNKNVISSAKHYIYATVVNQGVMDVTEGYVSRIYNKNSLELAKNARVNYLNNASRECQITGAGVEVVSLVNNKTCDLCGKTPCLVTVTDKGSVTVTDLSNYGEVENEGTMVVNGHNYAGGVINNAGTINVGDTGNFENSAKAVINTTGNINTGASCGQLLNIGTINAQAGTINNVRNYDAASQIFVTNNAVEMAPTGDSAGEIIFVMAEGATEHVKKSGNDKRITLVDKACKESVIGEFAKLTGSDIVRTAFDITFEKKPAFALNAIVKTIEVVANAKFVGEETGQVVDCSAITVNVAPKANLDLESAIQFKCAAISGNHHVGAGATLNGSASGTKH